MLSDHCLYSLSVCLLVCNVGLLWTYGWMDQDVIWYGGRPRPGHTVLDGDPAPPAPKWAQQPPTFWPMSVVAKQSSISVTAELVFLHDTAVVGNIHYTTCRRSSNKGFWKINLVFWKLWSLFICVVRPVHRPMRIVAWRNCLSGYSYDYELRQYNRDSWDSYLKFNWSR